jgi:hypothetical protein
MQITLELDNQHIEKLHALEKQLKITPSELIASLIDEIFDKKIAKTEGEKLLDILQETGFLGSLPDDENLSENYKDYLDWSHKI